MSVIASAARLGLALPVALGLIGPMRLAGPATALAAEPGGFNGYLALGGAIVPDFEGSKDYQPVPFFAGKAGYDEFYIEARGPKVRANVMPANVLGFGVELGPSAAYRFGRSDVENGQVDSLRDIDGSIAIGGFAKLYTKALLQSRDILGFEFEALNSVGEQRDGATVSFGPFYSFEPVDRVRIGFKASATYANDRYNQTYFGIDADNALRSGLAPYEAKGGFKDVGFSINATYRFAEHWAVSAMVGVTRLVGDAADSPVVKDAGSATAGIASTGIVYSF